MKLIPMSQADFEEFLAWAIPDYAEDKAKNGNCPAETALEKAKAEFDGYLPQGLQTPNNDFFCAFNENDQKVGWLWTFIQENNGNRYIHVGDVVVFEQYRRQSYGKQVFLAIENRAKDLNVHEIRLHVFGHNQPAINLYKKLGFEITNINMRKKLSY